MAVSTGKPRLRPRTSHYHDSCGHWCFRYSCRPGVDCGECHTKAFNAGANSTSQHEEHHA